jgi:hypothetical protein
VIAGSPGAVRGHRVTEMESRAWPLVKRWIDGAANAVTVLPVEQEAGREALATLEVTERSVLGALAVHTGGLAVDHGWLRVLGGPALVAWSDRLADGLVVGHDVVAGFFAVTRADGEVRYLAPDSLEWEGTEMGHAAWVHWTLTGDLAGFYETLRWTGWETEVSQLAPDEGLTLYPPPFTREGRAVSEATRGVTPMAELWDVQHHWIEELRR